MISIMKLAMMTIAIGAMTCPSSLAGRLPTSASLSASRASLIAALKQVWDRDVHAMDSLAPVLGVVDGKTPQELEAARARAVKEWLDRDTVWKDLILGDKKKLTTAILRAAERSLARPIEEEARSLFSRLLEDDQGEICTFLLGQTSPQRDAIVLEFQIAMLVATTSEGKQLGLLAARDLLVKILVEHGMKVLPP